MPPKAKAKKKAGYQLPEKFTEGFVLTDIYKKPWSMGKPIGQGGFGLIYLANRGESQAKRAEDCEFVVKIEPKENGPLFCETHFYINCAKEDEIKNYVKTTSLKHLAIPRYVSSGQCTYNGKEYRFLVMDRYQADVQSIIDKSPDKRHDEIGVICLMRQVIQSLEYIHQRGYVHGDIKGANLMLNNDHESYLVDYGLAVRFMRDKIHNKYEIKPERRHNGTIEYTSRDAHEGAQINRRSDLEILAYCVIHWLSGTLPWISLIKSPEQVQASKTKSMKNVKEFLSVTLGTVSSISDSVKSLIEFYLNEINKLQFDTEPPYAKILSKINDTLKSLGNDSTDNFYAFNQKSSSKIQSKKKIAKEISIASTSSTIDDLDNDIIDSQNTRKQARRPATKKKENVEKIIINETEESDIEEVQESKKSRIIPGLFVSASKPSIVEKLKEKESEPKSPRLNAKQKAINSPLVTEDTGRTPTRRGFSKLKEENEQKESYEKDEETPKYSLRTTPKRQLIGNDTPSNDILNKLNGFNLKPPRSPLTLTSTLNQDNKASSGPMLMKRKKNVPKSTVSTQTENSYLQTRYLSSK